jgi:DNA (cytosine-5)-methyltransferase 1
MTLRVGSLFSGIGGFDLGLERAGMEVIWQVENDPYCQKVLAKHWPDVPCYGDVHDVGAHNLAEVDVICGGFPCQPVSQAGKQRGQDDERWLWPQFARIVGELRPRYVLVENVPGILIRGLGDVLGDLAELGYDAEWGCVSAASVGAPHLRKRIFIVAHADSDDRRGRSSSKPQKRRTRVEHGGGGTGQYERKTDSDVAHREREGLEGHAGDGDHSHESRRLKARPDRPTGEGCLPRGEVADATVTGRETRRGNGMGDDKRSSMGDRQSARSCGKEGGHWAVEPNVGRVANGVPNRVDRLRGLGNAIVPQVAEWIGQRLNTISHTPSKGEKS